MPAKEIGDKESVVRVQQQQQDDDCLDRLLLVRSDLSSLTRQVLAYFSIQDQIFHLLHFVYGESFDF